MKNILFLVALSATFLNSCSSKAPQPIDQSATISLTEITEVEPSVQLYPVEGYFSTVKPTETRALVLDQASFEKHFQPAKTMENEPTPINFELERVGAIILPETPFDTKIRIDSTNLSDKTLHIYYSIDRGPEKRSFTIIPVEIFTFDANVDATSFSFDNAGTSIRVDNSK